MAKRVIIVTSDGCVPCDQLKKKLRDKGVKFTEYNVDTKVGEEFLVMMKNAGLKFYTTPTVIIKEDGVYRLSSQEELHEVEGLN